MTGTSPASAPRGCTGNQPMVLVPRSARRRRDHSPGEGHRRPGRGQQRPPARRPHGAAGEALLGRAAQPAGHGAGARTRPAGTGTARRPRSRPPGARPAAAPRRRVDRVEVGVVRERGDRCAVRGRDRGRGVVAQRGVRVLGVAGRGPVRGRQVRAEQVVAEDRAVLGRRARPARRCRARPPASCEQVRVGGLAGGDAGQQRGPGAAQRARGPAATRAASCSAARSWPRVRAVPVGPAERERCRCRRRCRYRDVECRRRRAGRPARAGARRGRRGPARSPGAPPACHRWWRPDRRSTAVRPPRRRRAAAARAGAPARVAALHELGRDPGPGAGQHGRTADQQPAAGPVARRRSARSRGAVRRPRRDRLGGLVVHVAAILAERFEHLGRADRLAAHNCSRTDRSDHAARDSQCVRG